MKFQVRQRSPLGIVAGLSRRVMTGMKREMNMSLEARLEWRSPMAGHVDRLVINRSALQADGRWLAVGEALNCSAEVSLDPTPWCQPAGLAPIEIDLGECRPRGELVPGLF
jgi:hypothetical protein